MATITTVDPYGEAAFPYCVVPGKVMDVFKSHDIDVDDFQRNGHVLVFELVGHTDGGGDMTHRIDLMDDELGDVSAWRRAFYETWNWFDPWTEAFAWCDSNGVPQGTPFDNGADLYADIDDYKHDVLEAVYDDLMSLNL